MTSNVERELDLGDEIPASQRVARNSVLYFTSLAVPAVIAIVLVPVTVRALGPARFGLLALAWALAEGSGMFDLGLARTTVRYVADATVKGADRLREIVTVSIHTQAAMGCVAGLVVFLIAPYLVRNVFHVPVGSASEATAMFRVLSLHIPILLAVQAMRAALEGAQRFDISTALRIPGSIASVVVPAVVAPLGGSLSTILWLLLIVRLILMLMHVAAVRRILLGRRWPLRSRWEPLREMLGYSGWVAVSAVLGPVLGSFDRFVIGSILGVAALGYYTGAAELSNRFLLIPVTALAAMLPALASTEARGERARTLTSTRAARRQLAAVLLPLCLFLFIFAPTVLRLWLGSAFAEQAGIALRVLSIGIFFNGLAHLPLGVLYGAGRPDLPAKIHIAEIAFLLPSIWVLVKMFGITGAAASWTLRCGADLALYEFATRRAVGRCEFDPAETTRIRWLSLFALALAGAFALILLRGSRSIPWAVLLVTVVCCGYATLAWLRVLSDGERRAWLAMVSRTRRQPVAVN